MLMRCGPMGLGAMGLPMTMAGTAAMGGMAMMAVGPFLAGVGVGAALVGGSTFALLMTVMRGLPRTATSMRGELAEVV